MSSVLFWTVNTAHHSQFIQQGVSSTPHRQTTHIEGSITNEPRWHQNWYQSKAPHNFLLVFHCNYLPGDLMIYWLKISHFCHFNLLQSHLKHSQGAGVLMGCGSWYQKAESLGYPLVKTARRDPMVTYFDSISAGNRRTASTCEYVALQHSRVRQKLKY